MHLTSVPRRTPSSTVPSIRPRLRISKGAASFANASVSRCGTTCSRLFWDTSGRRHSSAPWNRSGGPLSSLCASTNCSTLLFHRVTLTRCYRIRCVTQDPLSSRTRNASLSQFVGLATTTFPFWPSPRRWRWRQPNQLTWSWAWLSIESADGSGGTTSPPRSFCTRRMIWLLKPWLEIWMRSGRYVSL